MPAGMGSYDPQNIWKYGELDQDAMMSDLLNRLGSSVSAQFKRVLAAPEDRSNTLFTPSAGWSLRAWAAQRTPFALTLNIRVRRTGLAIPANSIGDIGLQQVGLLAVEIRPLAAVPLATYTAGPNYAGSAYSDGAVNVVSAPPNVGIANGAEIGLSGSYPLPLIPA